MNNIESSRTIEDRIKHFEKIGMIDPDCKFCQKIFYPELQRGNPNPFAPRHKASDRCRSGKYAHCTCDTCF